MGNNVRAKKQDYVSPAVSDPAEIVDRFKRLYQNLHAGNCRDGMIEQVYGEELVFEDSFHCIKGRENFISYCESLYENVSFISFEFHDEWIRDADAMLTWTMTYAHPRLRDGENIEVEGATMIRFEDKVVHHKDYFDGGRLLYENVPVLGTVINFLKKRLK